MGDIVPYGKDVQVINMALIPQSQFSEMIQVCLPRAAWRVARAFLSTDAKNRYRYALDYLDWGYEIPDDNEMDEIESFLDLALSASEEECLEGGTEMTLPIGSIVAYAGTSAPVNTAFCNGQQLYKYNYPDLYDVIGQMFGGTGDFFKLPDLEDRFLIDTSGTLGTTGGEAEHTLTVSEMPAHKHNLYWQDDMFAGGTKGDVGRVGTELENHYTGYEGGGNPHNNMPPWFNVNWLIITGEYIPTP